MNTMQTAKLVALTAIMGVLSVVVYKKKAPIMVFLKSDKVKKVYCKLHCLAKKYI